MIIYDIYFFLNGWNKAGQHYYKGGVQVYPPNPSRGWVVMGTVHPAFTPRTFRGVRQYLKGKGL